jgi:type IV secretion system protein VirD4
MKLPFDERPYCGLTNDRHATPVTYPGDRHIVLIGPARSGKDTGIITANLARLRRSMILIDPRGEQASIVYRMREKFSRMIVVNPYELLTDTRPWLKSHGFNCLALPAFNLKNPNFNDECNALADTIVKPDGAPHFTVSAKALVAAMIMHVCMKYGAKANLALVRQLLGEPYGIDENGNPLGLLRTLFEMSESGYPSLVAKVNRFLHPNNETRGVIATALAQTAFLDAVPIAADLTKGAFDFDEMKREIVTVIVILPATELDDKAQWLRIMVGRALRDLMRTPPGPQRPLLIINEAAQLGFLEVLASAMNIAGGFGVQIMTVWQSLAQIQHHYGKNADTILSARGVLSAVAPQDWVTADYLSKLCGNLTELMSSYDATPGKRQAERRETPQGLPMFRPEDLMRLPAGTMLNFIEPVSYPFLTRAPGYWALPWCQNLDPNPYYRPDNEPPGGQPKRGAPPQTNYREALAELQRRRRRPS